MTLDTTLNLPTLVTLGIAIVGLVAWFVRLEGRVTENARVIAGVIASREERDNRFGAMEALVQLTREQAQSYRTEVAERYATHASISEIKRYIITELSASEQRFETQINRLIEGK